MNVLIIKTGHTETFDPVIRDSHIVSLGDVLRTTVLLHLFQNDHVTWFTSPEARPLLEHNKYIHHLETNPERITRDRFDLVVNLERTSVKNGVQGKVFVGHDENNLLLTTVGSHHLETWLNSDLISSFHWSQKLFALLGKVWNGENYLLFPRESIDARYDLGLNWKVGSKWPSKSWPFANWEEIHRRVSCEHSVSFQEGFDDIPSYIAWIQSCKTLLTHDSLGLHIGLALGKKMVALFGPTKSSEIPLLKTKVLSLSEDPRFACPPCYQEQCRSKIHCVGALTLDSVESEIRNNLKEQDGPVTIRRKQALTSS